VTNDNETGLKGGGGIEMSTTVLPLRDARLPYMSMFDEEIMDILVENGVLSCGRQNKDKTTSVSLLKTS
jgi:hypothetical protein